MCRRIMEEWRMRRVRSKGTQVKMSACAEPRVGRDLALWKVE